MISDKVRPHHLERKALLYVRQSSAHRVLHNRESSALQYAMRDRLIALGWSEFEVIVDDLGRSAAGGVQRAAFERMVAQVCLGKVGAVAAREVSRWRRRPILGSPRQAVVFLTHIVSPRIINHFRRLKDETRGLLDVFLCIHSAANDGVAEGGGVADFRTSPGDEENVLPIRFAEKMRRGGTITPGFPDLAYMPALLSPRLSRYEYTWMVEYDVDFAGRWRDFFWPLLDSQADLMGTTFYPQADCSGWFHWTWFEPPDLVSARHYIRSFNPVVRFSRRMLNAYVAAVEEGGWRGHTEALFPAIASYNGFTIEDLGGAGPFTPEWLRGKNYLNSPAPNGYLTPGTFVHSPPTLTKYFHEAAELFFPRGYLYHPVKPIR